MNVWKDISESTDASQAFVGNHGDASTSFEKQSTRRYDYDQLAPMYSSSESNVTVASSFIALPDIAETSRGSGLVLSWIQETGVVVAAGNSPTIRVWDVNSERCARIFSTGLDTCTSALATKSLSSV